MTNPTQADLFRRFQVHIWNDEWPDPDGCIWEDARKTLEVLNAKPTGDTKPHDPKANPPLIWVEYLFPDGSLVEALSDGSGIDYPSSDCGAIYRQEDASQIEEEGPLSASLEDIQFWHLAEKVRAIYPSPSQ